MAVPPHVAEIRALVGDRLLLLPAVCAVVVDDRGEVLLHRRADTGGWALPGGIVDPGEQPADAVVREICEETGVRVVPDRVTGVYLSPEVRYANGDRAQYVVTAFACTPRPGDVPRVADDESLEVGYHPLDALPELPRGHLERLGHAVAARGRAHFDLAGGSTTTRA